VKPSDVSAIYGGSIGGGPAVRAAADDFYTRVLADPQQVGVPQAEAPLPQT